MALRTTAGARALRFLTDVPGQHTASPDESAVTVTVGRFVGLLAFFLLFQRNQGSLGALGGVEPDSASLLPTSALGTEGSLQKL